VWRKVLNYPADIAVLVDDTLAVAAAAEMAIEVGALVPGQVAEYEVEGLRMSLSGSIVAPSQVGQLGPQRVCCLGRPGFDGADRDAEVLGDLAVGEAVSD
jgi:hypothetical protein